MKCPTIRFITQVRFSLNILFTNLGETGFGKGELTDKGSNLKASIGTDPFSIKITRKYTDEDIFNSGVHATAETAFFYSDKFLQITTKKSMYDVVYGLGERRGDFKLKNGVYTIFPFEQEMVEDKGRLPTGGNLYGHHPFYVKVNTRTNIASGFYIHTSSALDFIIRDEYITVRAISGILDIHVFEGPTFRDVVKQYHDLIGRPTSPPMWALGWHQSRWGYESLQKMIKAIKLYELEKMPLSAIWHDKDYMENNTPFMVNEEEFR